MNFEFNSRSENMFQKKNKYLALPVQSLRFLRDLLNARGDALELKQMPFIH